MSTAVYLKEGCPMLPKRVVEEPGRPLPQTAAVHAQLDTKRRKRDAKSFQQIAILQVLSPKRDGSTHANLR
jgi:hypothetical protein